VTVPGEAAQGPGPETTATATCPKRRKAVAGGFRATEPSSRRRCEKGTLVSGGFRSTPISEGNLMFVFTSHREGDRWAASAIQGLEGPGTLTSIGYCG
jgi:hypothetical protein